MYNIYSINDWYHAKFFNGLIFYSAYCENFPFIVISFQKTLGNILQSMIILFNHFTIEHLCCFSFLTNINVAMIDVSILTSH